MSDPAQDGPTHQVQITKFVEAEPEITTSTQTLPPIDYLKTANPYPHVDLSVLQRKYRVATFTWSSIAAGNLILDFPATLNTVSYIADILRTYRYMQAGIQLEIRINSTQFHFGSLLVSWIPNTNSNTSHATGVFMQSGNHPVVLSASTQNSATIDIPYVNPDSFYPIAGSTSNICKVFITPLTFLGLATANLTDTVEVQIFASFTNPLVAGYLALPVSGKRDGRSVPLMSQQSGNVDRGSIRSEAASKAAKNSEVGISGALTTATKILESVPILGGAIQDFLGVLTFLDKPLNASPSQPYVINMARDWASGEGVDGSNSLSMKKLPCLSDKVQLMGNVKPITTIQDVISVPMLRNNVTLTNSFNTLTIPIIPLDYDPSLVPADYFQYISRHFAYWAGSIKYMLCFYCSPFVSCRFKVSALYQSPIATTPDSGDIAATIVDVKGDTVFKTTIPYLKETMMCAMLDINTPPLLHIEAISPMVGQSFDGVEPKIYLQVWRSAGEDMKFSQQCERIEFPSFKKETVVIQPPAIKMRQEMDPQAVFRNTFDPIVFGCQFVQEDGVVRPETVDSINEACKRYVRSNNSVPATIRTYPDPGFGGFFMSISNLFKYWRGGRRMKLVIQKPTTPATVNDHVTVVPTNPQGSFDISNGATYVCPAIWPVMEFEIPWYSTRPFFPCEPATQVISRAFDLPADIKLNANFTLTFPAMDITLISAADDFQYGWLLAPTQI